ncbi:MAG: hypothetical protein R3F49_18370 [Planctomycetota bacterium]
MRSFLLHATLLVSAAAVADAQYSSDFEALTASGAGTLLTGQDGYYIPAGTTSVDFTAHSYAGNAYAVAANPTGGAQFIAGNGPAGGAFARAQRDLTYGTGVWTIAYDVHASFVGTLPTADNIGSVSIQPFPGSQSFIALAQWVDINTATNWNANYIWFDIGGAQLTESVADPAFQNLSVGHWYRWETDFDLTTNLIVEVRLKDLTTGTTATNQPVARYLEGGAAGSGPPTGFRFFGGGGVAGNVLAFDNIRIGPALTTIGARYCSPAVTNSSGQPASIAAAGSDVAATNSFSLVATELPNNSFGFFLTSQTQGFVANPGGSQGNLCLGGSIGRYVGAGQIQNSGAAGAFQLALNLTQTPTPNGLVAITQGQTWNFQSWFRDTSMGAATSNFTDAVRVLFQ